MEWLTDPTIWGRLSDSGRSDEIHVMMAAVVIAVILMIIASKPLSAFVSARPTLIILCLGFLVMGGVGRGR
jgi:predicted tellurium resistance membrane protein TerC